MPSLSGITRKFGGFGVTDQLAGDGVKVVINRGNLVLFDVWSDFGSQGKMK